MSLDTAVAETPAASEVGPVPQGPDRSPESLVILLAKTAERVRTDPQANLTHCAVRWTAQILCIRLDERLPDARGRPAVSVRRRRRSSGDWLVVGICVAVGYSMGVGWPRPRWSWGR
jgi:hypothetical protein